MTRRNHNARFETSVKAIFAILWVFFFTVATCYAQIVSASLRGTITDPSGAIVPGASVTAADVGTGVSAKSVTDSSGNYSFPSLKPGNYNLRVEKQGFNATVISAITLSVAQAVQVDAVLQVGAVSTAVQVVGVAPLVTTTSASIGTVIGEQQIVDLPLNLRRFGALATLSPGAVDTTIPAVATPSQGNSPFYSSFSETIYSANGLRPGSNLVLIDGMMSRSLAGGGFGVQPPPEALREFNLQTNVYSTAFGVTAGSTLNVVTKSGTNSWHGDAWNFLRNDVLDARNFFNVNKRDPLTNEEIPGSARPVLRRNQFGFDVGGPIKKDKTFIFGSYEGLRQISGRATVVLVPSAAEKNGDFSSHLTGDTINLCGAGGPNNLNFDTAQLFDPATESLFTCPAGSANAGSTILIGNPVPGNIITNVDPVAQKVLSDYPAANRPGFPNFVNPQPFTRNDDQMLVRIDHIFSSKDSIFGHYILANTHVTDNLLAGSVLPGFRQFLDFRGHHAVGQWTHTFSPFLLNDTRVGWQRNYDISNCDVCPRAKGTLESFGIQGLTVISPDHEQTPFFSFVNYAAWGDAFYRPTIVSDLATTFEDNLTWIHGRHTISAGANITQWSSPFVSGPRSPAGDFFFSGQYSSLAGQIPGVGGISDLADFELGSPAFAEHTTAFQDVRLRDGRLWSFYAHDDIKVSRNLTLNIGLRWEWHVPPIENANNLTTFFPTGAAFSGPGNGVLITALPDAQNDALCSQNPSLIAPLGGCVVASSSLRAQLGFTGRKREAVNLESPKAFLPRIGLAWRPLNSDKFIIHAGGGIFADIPMLNPFFSPGTNNPVTSFTPLFQTAFGSPPPTVNGLPATTQTVFGLGTVTNISQSFALLNAAPNYKMPQVAEWSLGVESQLATNWGLSVYYVGNGAWHLDNLHVFFNQPRPGVGDPQPRRPYPDLNGFIFYDTTDVNSNYHALQTKLTKRFSAGLSFIASYTWAKSMWETGGDDVAGGHLLPQDDNNIHDNYGRGAFDNRHAFVFSSVWQLPIGKGRNYLNQGGVANAFLGGWEASGIVKMATGLPFTVFSSQDFSNSLSISPRPDRICNGSGKKTVDNYFNTGCFTTDFLSAALASGTPRFGNSGTNILDGPAYRNLDLALIKRNTIRERLTAEFRAEFFNAFNNVHFGIPNSSIGSGGVGQISSAGDGRVIQFALKLTF